MIIKREFLICCVIIICIVFLDIILNNHFKLERNNLEKNISNIQEKFMKKDDIENEVIELSKNWNEFEKIAAFYAEHDELEKISLKIDLTKNAIKTGETDDVLDYLEEIDFWLNHIYEKDKILMKNIF